MKAPRERDVQAACLALLALHRIPAWRTNSGTLKVGRRLVRLAPAGTADILGCLPPSGRLLCVEAKRPGGRLRDTQRVWLEAMAAAGALCLVVSDVRQLEEALRAKGCIP